ncbi:MAG: AraC family transcriptional regulator [Lachnospiraceae bacterium]|nr:AraC family transcriptional regulator [Lachnospiraceae bacterium]
MHIRTYLIEKEHGYQEKRVDGRIIAKFYQFTNPTKEVMAIPDACVDIQFVKEGEHYEPYFCGTFLSSHISNASEKEETFGIKFEPGVIPACMGLSPGELIERVSPIEKSIAMREFSRILEKEKDFEKRVEIFVSEFSNHDHILAHHETVLAITQHLMEARGAIEIKDVATEMMYSQKYLDRVFHVAIGITMKRFATIIKIQKAVSYLEKGNEEDVYEKLGYYDQSHFIKEFKKYTSLTPAGFRKNMDTLMIV